MGIINTKKYNKTGGILFLVLAIFQLLSIFIVCANRTFLFVSLLYLISYSAISYCLYKNKRDNIMVAGIAFLVLLQIISFF